MTQEQKEQFELFKDFVRKWMNEDCQSAFDKSDARFLVLMGIFNYIEMMGAFIIGHKKGKGECEKRFKAFFKYLGTGYQALLNLPNVDIYNELRCGFTHELMPKSREFYVYKEYTVSIPSLVVGNCTSSAAGYFVSSESISIYKEGIIFKDNEWHIVLSKLLKDYKNAVDKLIKEIENENCDQGRLDIFFNTLGQFNFKNLKI